jgi:hypothetical protein
MARLTDRLFGGKDFHPGKDALSGRGLDVVLRDPVGDAIGEALQEMVKLDLAIAGAVVEMIGDQSPRPGSLCHLSPPDPNAYAPDGKLSLWNINIPGSDPDSMDLDAARYLIAAGMNRWIRNIEDSSLNAEQREQKNATLAEELIETLRGYAPGGVRAGEDAPAPDGGELVQTLLAAAQSKSEGK